MSYFWVVTIIIFSAISQGDIEVKEVQIAPYYKTEKECNRDATQFRARNVGGISFVCRKISRSKRVTQTWLEEGE